MPLYCAPNYAPADKHLIFLAGPIQGARDWHADAALAINTIDPFITMASPRQAEITKGDFTPEMYFRQVDWEHDHLDRAATTGVILFWLAKEDQHRCERAYAQTSRFELGVAVGWHKYKDSRVVVGIEDGFSNARYLRYTLGKKYPDIAIHDDLQGTCRAAVNLLKS